MKKKLLVDGYNLAHKHPEISLWLKKGDTEKTIQLLISWLQSGPGRKHSKIILVFDGKRGNFNRQHYSSNIKLIFSKKPQTADDIIRDFIRNAENPSDWTVVSSDNEIIYTSQDHGAHTIKSETFLDQYSRNPKSKNKRPNNSTEKYNPENIDVDYWLKQFGDDKEL